MNDLNPMLEALLRVMRDLRVQYDLAARSVGLTMARARVLSCLSRIEGATQAELAAEIGIEPPTLMRQLKALEAAGFIERRATEGDQRKRALYLTARARAMRTTHFIQQVRDDLLAGISEEEQAQVRDVLARVSRNAAGLSQP